MLFIRTNKNQTPSKRGQLNPESFMNIKNLFTRLGGASCAAWVLPALIAGLGLIPAGRVTAQTFTTLHSFNYSDGNFPVAGLILSGNTLYGTAEVGGTNGNGTVFAVNTGGTGFTNLYSFTAASGALSTNSDGAAPVAGLILSGNTLYGTAANGGSSGNGTVFAVNTDGTGFTNLHSFTAFSSLYPYGNSDGGYPFAGLILSGNTLYGTASRGGSSDNGTVFRLNTAGTGFTNLYTFTGGSDGAEPDAGLLLSGNTLYGTAYYGGRSSDGTVFAVNTDGTGFTNLHTFTVTTAGTNSDGAYPYAGLILSGNTLYGTAQYGGSLGNGTVFRLNTDGTGFTNLHSFTAFSSLYPFGNSDGANPNAGLILSGNTLYGTAEDGGSPGNGTVFAVNTDGTGFTTLHSFTATSGPFINSDGAYPYAGLILSGYTLYGTAAYGGSSGNGTVFSLSFAPQLTIIRSGANVILTWPTHVAGFNYSGFTLQSTTNLVSPAVWNTVSPAPVIVNGRNTVTNSISGTQKFYRLSL
jgi:uncharacterized repeat protein (TIGR03803 family)